MKRLLLIIFVCLSVYSFGQRPTEFIRLNQIGFLPFAEKNAIIVNSSSTEFSVKNNLGAVVFTNTLSPARTWSASGEICQIADFTILTTPGEYTISVPNVGESVPFVINDTCFNSVNNALVKAFYFNRASTALLTEHAGIYARAAGHPDTIVIVLPSAAGPTRIAGDTIRAAKGWYDAGDYNKYIVNSGITTGTLLQAYERYSEHYDTLTWNIPESNNSIPDLLDEIKWNLDWMLTMQDPADGGVYNKTTEAAFGGATMPVYTTSKRYVVAKGTAAAFDFAIVMAMAGRIYKPFYPSFADSCLAAAEYAWDWAIIHPNLPYNNPSASGSYPAVSTGGYGDNSFGDERTWAATELLISTKNSTKYASDINLSQNFDIPMWRVVATPALYSLYNHRDSIGDIIDTALVKTKILAKATTLQLLYSNSNPYKVPISNFTWGSNGEISNIGIMLLYAFDITKDISYYNAALSSFDYILGRNATEYSFVCGFGEKFTKNIHHRPSEADGIPNSIPGFLAGGPYSGNKTDCSGTYSTFPAKAYRDETCSFTTNEIAINWQAPAVFLANGIVIEYKNWMASLPDSFALVPVSHINFSRTESSSSFLVTTNTAVSLKTNDTWYSFVDDSIRGNGTITLTIEEFNEGDSIRHGEFYVVLGEDTIKTITVSQLGQLTNFRLEAEDYIAAQNIGTETTTDVGGGLNLGWIDATDTISYNLDISVAGTYKITYRTASNIATGKIYLMLQDSSFSTITVLPTGGWQVWSNVIDTAYFAQGIHTITLQVPVGGFNLNYMDFSLISTENIAPEHEQPAPPIIDDLLPIISKNTISITNPVTHTIAVYGLQGNEDYICEIYSMNGVKLYSNEISENNNRVPVSCNPGNYICKIIKNNEVISIMLIVQ